MSEWQEVKLKEICKFKYGSNLPANFRIEGNYPVYGSSSVVSHHIDYYVKVDEVEKIQAQYQTQ